MDKIRIRGGLRLKGTINISGAKNAALPLMAASLLSDEPLVLGNIPHLADITTLAQLLVNHGATVETNGHDDGGNTGGRELRLHAARITSTTAPYDIVRKMRASVLVLGPLVARMGEAKGSLPGGCAIGARPIDLHLKGLENLGARIVLEDGYVHASAPKGLRGNEVRFPFVSVGATENLMMAAVLAQGTTVLDNAAREPEIMDLADCLNAMGAKVSGAGSSRIEIQGVARLHGAQHRVMSDRIEAGTYAAAAAVTGGEIDLIGARLEHMGAIAVALAESGSHFEVIPDGLRATRHVRGIQPVDITTQPYPGFPTDLQAQMMALLALANGASTVTEAIFENRFMHVPELARMGARISLQGSTAIIRGVESLHGAPVMATDLRASVSLVLAALAAKGETDIGRVYHLDRGYERLVEKLAPCGADIERLPA